MPTLEEVAKQPLEQRLGRMSRTAEDLAAAIRGQSEAALVRRPDSKNWAANEVICHLRDIEEVYFVRIHAILLNDGPKIYAESPCWCASWRSARLPASHPPPRCACRGSGSRLFSLSASRLSRAPSRHRPGRLPA